MNKKNALLMVYHKDGIAEFAEGLIAEGYRVYGSRGTVEHLRKEGVEATDIGSIVGDPILGHRVVSLSREIAAGLLARDASESLSRGETPEDIEELEKNNIVWFDVVCVDFYPLAEELANPAHTKESIIEKTDIGGPTALRAAAKGGRIVICDPNDRAKVIEWLQAGQPDNVAFRDALAAKAEYMVARYAAASAEGRSGGTYRFQSGEKIADCKYGENAYQAHAALFAGGSSDPLALERFELIEGTPPSYNNWCDVDRLLQTTTHIAAAFDTNFRNVPLIAVGVKHGNPCGAAVGSDSAKVLTNMLAGDPLSIFGGLIMTNFPIDETCAEVISGKMLDGIAAPDFAPEAREKLRRKGDRCRFLKNPALVALTKDSLDTAPRTRYVRGGFLRQPNYTFTLDLSAPELEKHGAATKQQEEDMLLASAIGMTSNSNTIALVKDGMLIGNGVGQQDRVGAANLALTRATRASHDIEGAVAYSDSFFPFPDGPETLINAGITTILSTSGSKNDKLSIELCKEHDIALYMIPDSLGRGFFGH